MRKFVVKAYEVAEGKMPRELQPPEWEPLVVSGRNEDQAMREARVRIRGRNRRVRALNVSPHGLIAYVSSKLVK